LFFFVVSLRLVVVGRRRTASHLERRHENPQAIANPGEIFSKQAHGFALGSQSLSDLVGQGGND
jgi:hypothetical protein